MLTSISQKILFNLTGQTLIFDCAEGRPTGTPTFAVYRSDVGDTGTAEFSGNATVETSPNTTFSSASGTSQANRKRCNLTATTGCVVGRSYLATSTTNESEWVEVGAISSAAYVDAVTALQNDYASASTFVSTRITGAIDATWVADTNKLSDGTSFFPTTDPQTGEILAGKPGDPNPGYRILWSYVVSIGGTSYTFKRYSYCELVRQPGFHNVRPEDINLLFPGWINQLPEDERDTQGKRVINEAYDQVRLDLHGIWRDEDMIRNQWITDKLVQYKTVLLSAEGGVIPAPFSPSEFVTIARQNYQRVFDANVAVTQKTPFALDNAGGASKISALPLMRR